VFSSVQSCHCLTRVQVMTCSDQNCADIHIIENFLFVSRTVPESKFLRGMAAPNSGGVADTDELNSSNLLDGRQ